MIVYTPALFVEDLVDTAIDVAVFTVDTLLAENDVTAKAIDVLKSIITEDLFDDFLPSEPQFR